MIAAGRPCMLAESAPRNSTNARTRPPRPRTISPPRYTTANGFRSVPRLSIAARVSGARAGGLTARSVRSASRSKVGLLTGELLRQIGAPLGGALRSWRAAAQEPNARADGGKDEHKRGQQQRGGPSAELDDGEEGEVGHRIREPCSDGARAAVRRCARRILAELATSSSASWRTKISDLSRETGRGGVS